LVWVSANQIALVGTVQPLLERVELPADTTITAADGMLQRRADAVRAEL
jgi:hypothetical protein